MNVRASLAAILLALAGMHVAHANSPGDYAYTFAIETPAAATSSAWRIELTPSVYAWIQDASLRDIEVFNAAGQPVPFAAFAPERAATVHESSANLPVLALPPTPVDSSGNLQLTIDRDAKVRRIDLSQSTATPITATRDVLLDASGFDHPLDRIMLGWSTPMAGVVARFEVKASDDLQAWRSVGNATVLSLEQDGAHLERHDIVLNSVRAKYLRLHRLDDGPDLAGLSAQARSLEHGSAAPPRTWLDASLVATSGADAPPPGVARFDYVLPSALPIEAVRIELANDNALAPLTLSARMSRAPENRWSEIARVTAFRLRSGEETIQNSDTELANGSRLQELRVESSASIAAAPHVSAGFRPDGFVFLAEGNGPYTLAVGSVRTRHATYPVETALASLRAKLGKDWQPPLAQIGAAKESAGAIALKVPPPPIPWSRWLLWGVLIAGAALVGGFALSLLRSASGDGRKS